jgi:hypothetical protein
MIVTLLVNTAPRFCSFGSLGSISNVISVPSTVLRKLHVLFDLMLGLYAVPVVIRLYGSCDTGP